MRTFDESMFEKHQLSKSTYIRGIQCPKSLYLYKNFIHLRDQPSAEQQSIFNRGNKVGVFAQQLFPGGKDVSILCKGSMQKAAEYTQELIQGGQEVIYEAVFQYNKVLVILDILVKKDGKWWAYEVKSSVKISSTYIQDACLQYWVITRSGLPLEDIFIVNIDSSYVRDQKLDPWKLFKTTSVKSKALNQEEEIGQQVMRLLEVAENPQMPDVTIGEQCFSPYTCDFMGNCWKNLERPSIFELSGASKSELFQLYQQGVRTIDQIPEKNQLGNDLNIHLHSYRKKEALVDQKRVSTFLSALKYPVLFMDFETFMPAIPIFKGTKPYQHLPFQFSIHRIGQEGADAEHAEFIAETGLDPRRSFLMKLLEAASGNGSILVYDSLMERGVLNALRAEFPEHAPALDQLLSRLVDLAKPFQEKWYYHWEMKNSCSIKNVLPAMVKGLNFQHLSISSGSMAMIAYERLQTESDLFQIEEEKQRLLEYCQMDTLAMVKVFEVLCRYREK